MTVVIENLQNRLARLEAEMQAIKAELNALTQQTPSRHKPSLAELGISREEALAIRYQFGAMAADWDDPEMDVYDDEELDKNQNIVFFPTLQKAHNTD